MNELDNSEPITESADRVTRNDLPDLTMYGYQVCEKLSENHHREKITYLAKDLNFGDGQVQSGVEVVDLLANPLPQQQEHRLVVIKEFLDRKSTRLNSSHRNTSRMPSSA